MSTPSGTTSKRIRYCRLFGASPTSLRSPQVSIEVVITAGIPRHTVVGLAHGAVREALDRIRSAILTSGYRFPRGAITVNLAPADTRKDGSAFDLPIALGLLAADGQIKPGGTVGSEWLTMGELALDGSVRPVSGVMVALMNAIRHGQQRIILPGGNLPETRSFQLAIHPVACLRDAVQALSGEMEPVLTAEGAEEGRQRITAIDFAQVVGQQTVKRALEVAAAGRHNLRLVGPPGCGKTMMARCFAGILPQWSREEALETTCIHSLRKPGMALLPGRPFRSPHHSISEAGLLGGGTPIRPGEVSLAHNGVLFLDELPEFNRSVLEGLREPLQEGQVAISRAGGVEQFPAAFQLMAAMNPCPCGYAGDTTESCRCSVREQHRYRSRMSGPLLDRVDLHVTVPSVDPLRHLGSAPESTESMAARVHAAAARLASARPEVSKESREALLRAASGMGLSMRAVTRCQSVAQTIAALDGSDSVERCHISEALRYRHVG